MDLYTCVNVRGRLDYFCFKLLWRIHGRTFFLRGRTCDGRENNIVKSRHSHFLCLILCIIWDSWEGKWDTKPSLWEGLPTSENVKSSNFSDECVFY